MIVKIPKIKNLGIFSDFKWDASLPDFKRYNLIYGWNGSGKTTLSNFLSEFPNGSMKDWPNLEYEVATNLGVAENGKPLPVDIRVFNRDYVNNNVYSVSGTAKAIYILGEENKKLAEEITRDKEVLITKQTLAIKIAKEIEDLGKQQDKIFTEIAKTIGANTSGLATRTYRQPDAKLAFDKLTKKVLLEDKEVEKYSIELKQLERPDVHELISPTFEFDSQKFGLTDFITSVAVRSSEICAQSVESVLVERLKENQDISKWVEQGIAIHTTHGSKICEFCTQDLPPDRMRTLAGYFNDADKQLKDKIDSLLQSIESAKETIKQIVFSDKANFYEELQRAYQDTIDASCIVRDDLLQQLADLQSVIENKKLKTTEKTTLISTINGTDFEVNLTLINSHIVRHNAKTANFKSTKDGAQSELELHYLSTIYDEVFKIRESLSVDETEIKKITKGDLLNPLDLGIEALSQKINDNLSQISSAHKGCEEINKALKTFLGRDELYFNVVTEGYALMRDDGIAEKLSEGEKTAIGFVHFVIHLQDQNFDSTNSVIVIDDPISSLDSSSIFQAFAYLKNAVKEAKQVFIMTHNFDFLRLLINWINSSKEKFSYYMIKNSYNTSKNRIGTIAKLDNLLCEHESEYHYLFKILYKYKSDGTIESAYHIPNVARKVLDTFLMFRVPNSKKNYHKLEELKPYFDENKLSAIYKFTNDQSHITGKGFDPALVLETQKNVEYLLEMIESVFPDHYRIITTSMGVNPSIAIPSTTLTYPDMQHFQ